MTYNEIKVSENCTKIQTLGDLLNYYEREGNKEKLKEALDIIEGLAADAKKVLNECA